MSQALALHTINFDRPEVVVGVVNAPTPKIESDGPVITIHHEEGQKRADETSPATLPWQSPFGDVVHGSPLSPEDILEVSDGEWVESVGDEDEDIIMDEDEDIVRDEDEDIVRDEDEDIVKDEDEVAIQFPNHVPRCSLTMLCKHPKSIPSLNPSFLGSSRSHGYSASISDKSGYSAYPRPDNQHANDISR
jgi:hypothetical protein